MRFYKKEIERFKWKIQYIKRELKTGRHIRACLGSSGLTFNSNIERFNEFLKQENELELLEKIKKICF